MKRAAARHYMTTLHSLYSFRIILLKHVSNRTKVTNILSRIRRSIFQNDWEENQIQMMVTKKVENLRQSVFWKTWRHSLNLTLFQMIIDEILQLLSRISCNLFFTICGSLMAQKSVSLDQYKFQRRNEYLMYFLTVPSITHYQCLLAVILLLSCNYDNLITWKYCPYISV
jgi:hypothetical protein